MATAAWGVRLERIGSAVMVAPSGVLGGPSVERLRDIIRSREPGLELLVLDLRDLSIVEDDGLGFVLQEAARAAGQGHDVAIVAGSATGRAIAASTAGTGVIVHHDPDELLAPYRARRRARR
jgi:anti-anti-sigma regulatory factor